MQTNLRKIEAATMKQRNINIDGKDDISKLNEFFDIIGRCHGEKSRMKQCQVRHQEGP